MTPEPISPELVLVDPELAARARAGLTAPDLAPVRQARPARPPAPPSTDDVQRGYPFWARVTAALWLVVVGILIGGAAIPHAQEQPRLVPAGQLAPDSICEDPAAPTPAPSGHTPIGPLSGR